MILTERLSLSLFWRGGLAALSRLASCLSRLLCLLCFYAFCAFCVFVATRLLWLTARFWRGGLAALSRLASCLLPLASCLLPLVPFVFLWLIAFCGSRLNFGRMAWRPSPVLPLAPFVPFVAHVSRALFRYATGVMPWIFLNASHNRLAERNPHWVAISFINREDSAINRRAHVTRIARNFS